MNFKIYYNFSFFFKINDNIQKEFLPVIIQYLWFKKQNFKRMNINLTFKFRHFLLSDNKMQLRNQKNSRNCHQEIQKTLRVVSKYDTAAQCLLEEIETPIEIDFDTFEQLKEPLNTTN